MGEVLPPPETMAAYHRDGGGDGGGVGRSGHGAIMEGAEHDRESVHAPYVGVGMPNLAGVVVPHLESGRAIELPVEMDSLLAALPVLESLRGSRSSGWTKAPASCNGEAHNCSQPLLPPLAAAAPQRLTVVLDLDETLVHCRLDELESPRPNFTVNFEDTEVVGFVYLRPSVMLFLEVAARLFEIVVFTASSQNYADQVLNRLDPQRRNIAKRLYRQHCKDSNGTFLKDLRELGRPLERALLVDNSPVSLMLCPDNGVLVSSWTAEATDDRELLDLLLLLQECAEQLSVTEFLAKRYGLAEFLEELFHRPDDFFVAQ